MSKLHETESPDMSAWSTAERFIVARLDRLEGKQDAQTIQITEINGKVSGLEVKSSIFGVAGGFLATILAFLMGKS